MSVERGTRHRHRNKTFQLHSELQHTFTSMVYFISFSLLVNPYPRIHFSLIFFKRLWKGAREGGRGWVRKKEKPSCERHQLVASYKCPDRKPEQNLQPFGVQADTLNLQAQMERANFFLIIFILKFKIIFTEYRLCITKHSVLGERDHAYFFFTYFY